MPGICNYMLELPKYWYGFVEIDLHTSDCKENCIENGMCVCRCKTIDPEIINIDYNDIIEYIIDDCEVSDIKKKYIEHLVNSYLYSFAFIIFCIKGYYGEEADVKLVESVQYDLQEKLNEIELLTDSEIIKLY
jgi:hypothetical protein